MAIRAIPKTTKQKRLNSVENSDNELRNRRERRSSSSSSTDSSNDDWGNESQQEYVSISTENNVIDGVFIYILYSKYVLHINLGRGFN